MNCGISVYSQVVHVEVIVITGEIMPTIEPSSSAQAAEEKEFKKTERELDLDSDDLDSDENESGAALRAREEAEAALELEKLAQAGGFNFEEENDFDFDAVDNILDLNESTFPKFTLAKNKARFLRMVSWYRQKEEWIEVAPVSGVLKLFKQQSKELE
jgi:hypothetical protein